MKPDMFIQIDDIKGDSIDAKRQAEIHVLSWDWGMSQKGSSHGGPGSGSGKVAVRDFSFVKFADSATANLVKYCCAGRHFSRAKLTVRKAGGPSSVEYFRLEMLDGLVTKVALGNTCVLDQWTEIVTLNFASFTCEYVPQTKDGAPGAAIPAMWNIARNSER